MRRLSFDIASIITDPPSSVSSTIVAAALAAVCLHPKQAIAAVRFFSAQGRHSNTITGQCQQSEHVFLQHIGQYGTCVQGTHLGEAIGLLDGILAAAVVSLAAWTSPQTCWHRELLLPQPIYFCDFT